MLTQPQSMGYLLVAFFPLDHGGTDGWTLLHGLRTVLSAQCGGTNKPNAYLGS